MKFGRNQLIGIWGGLIAFLATLAFGVFVVVIGKGDAVFDKWTTFAIAFTPMVLGVILGAAAYVKGKEAEQADIAPTPQ